MKYSGSATNGDTNNLLLPRKYWCGSAGHSDPLNKSISHMLCLSMGVRYHGHIFRQRVRTLARPGNQPQLVSRVASGVMGNVCVCFVQAQVPPMISMLILGVYQEPLH